MVKLERYKKNPIIKPKDENDWESKATFNPGAIYLDGKVHILYRALSQEFTSTIGYASSKDGFTIDERLSSPVYVPRTPLEKADHVEYYGCEDPRLTLMGNKIYMTYTGFNSQDAPSIAITSIKKQNFLNRKWEWEEPKEASVSHQDNKNSCLLEEKRRDRYVMFHRPHSKNIWIDYLDNLKFGKRRLMGSDWIKTREDNWDSLKIGIGGPPIKTKLGWLLIYHGLSAYDDKYRLGMALLDNDDPTKVLARPEYPLIEPEKEYEKTGVRHNTIFACGNVVINDTVYVYYGAGDTTVGVATASLKDLLKELKKHKKKQAKE